MNSALLAVPIILASLANNKTNPRPQIPDVDMDKFFLVLREQESGEYKTVEAIPFGKDGGDNGKAIGPFQIWHSYWTDATEFDKTIGGKYEDCRQLEYSKKVVRAYLKRYCKNYKNLEQMVRVHNGGPNGYRKASTLKYYRQFMKKWNSTTEIK